MAPVSKTRSPEPPGFERRRDADRMQLELAGDWTFPNVERLESLVASLDDGVAAVEIRCGGIRRIDLTGAWLLYRYAREVRESGGEADFEGFKAEHFRYLEQIQKISSDTGDRPVDEGRPGLGARIAALLEYIGRCAIAGFEQVGLVAHHAALLIGRPSRLALRELLQQIDATGVRAIPIVTLIAVLIGIVLAYQGSVQLSAFGASVYTVDLVAISVLREMGVLLTAIIVAGRSGSAYAATIGTMKLNEETEALTVIGKDPVRVLIAPRIVALMITMPLLTVIADAAGIFGGWFLGVTVLDIPTNQFMDRLKQSAELADFLVGLSKAPLFGLVIAGVSTLRGMAVTGSAEELGRLTTRAVVQSITLVIVVDAMFSIIFSELGI